MLSVSYSVNAIMRALARMASEARRINIHAKRLFRGAPEEIGSHNVLKLHPRLRFHVRRVEKIVGTYVYTSPKVSHIQYHRSLLGIGVVALPRDVFFQVLELGKYSLHGNIARVIVERGKTVPGEEELTEAHRVTLERILGNREDPVAKSAAHEYLSMILAGAAAFELLGGRAVVPAELQRYVEEYKRALRGAKKGDLLSFAEHYSHFLRAARKLGFHAYST